MRFSFGIICARQEPLIFPFANPSSFLFLFLAWLVRWEEEGKRPFGRFALTTTKNHVSHPANERDQKKGDSLEGKRERGKGDRDEDTAFPIVSSADFDKLHLPDCKKDSLP